MSVTSASGGSTSTSSSSSASTKPLIHPEAACKKHFKHKLTELPHKKRIHGITVSKHGKWLATASPTLVMIHDISTLSYDVVAKLETSCEEWWSLLVCFSEDDTILATGSADPENKYDIQFWNTARWEKDDKYGGKTCHGHTSILSCGAFSPKVKGKLASGTSEDFRIWSVESRDCLRVLKRGKAVLDCRWDPTGDVVVFSDFGQKVVAVDGDSGTELRSFSLADPSIKNPREATQIRFSVEGDNIYLWTCGHDKYVRKFLFEDGAMVDKFQVEGEANGMIIGPDGTWFCVASYTNKSYCYDIATRKMIGERLDNHSASCTCIAACKRGDYIFTSGSDGTINVWQNPAVELYVKERMKVIKIHLKSKQKKIREALDVYNVLVISARFMPRAAFV